MKMKRYCLILLIISIVCLSIGNVYGESVDEALAKVKEELGGFELYPKETIYGIINAELATKGLSVAGSPEKQIFVYGNNDDASEELEKLGMDSKDKDGNFRALGYSISGFPFPNPVFLDDYPGRSADSVTTWYTTKELQADSNVVNVKHATINAWLGTEIKDRDNRLAELVKKEAYDPDGFLGLHPELRHRSQLDPSDKNYLDLKELAYILQPPTENSWGMAIFFHVVPGVGSGVLYTTAMMKPYSMAVDPSVDIDLPPGSFDLDYNILERKIKFDFGDSFARLTLLGGSWSGNATGQLDITNHSADIYNNYYEVTRNDAVNEASETIKRNPLIRTVIKRKDFGDNPVERVYGATNTKTGKLTSSGSASRPYRYSCDGENCSGHDRTASAFFDRLTNRYNITVKVYNGMDSIAPPDTRNRIENIGSDFNRQLWWTSKPFDFDVVRLMYNMNEDDSLSDPIPVGGRYKRTFTNQDEAQITWGIASSMAQEYITDRNKAKNRNYRITGDEKAVFASDLIYKNKDYPIRSGYYFNPRGTYTFKIVTSLYKNTTANTSEHTALVGALKNAFRYESDMIYITQDRTAVTIAGTPVSLTGPTYAARAESATISNSPYFDIDVDEAYSKTTEELLHSTYTESATDSRFKKVLEGYQDSGTLNSSNLYKYVEFPHKDVKAYRVTETTNVTITINQSNKKLYTHVSLKNAAYTVRAYIDRISLGSVTANRLTNLAGIGRLDSIEIEVLGSMYDDPY